MHDLPISDPHLPFGCTPADVDGEEQLERCMVCECELHDEEEAICDECYIEANDYDD